MDAPSRPWMQSKLHLLPSEVSGFLLKDFNDLFGGLGYERTSAVEAIRIIHHVWLLSTGGALIRHALMIALVPMWRISRAMHGIILCTLHHHLRRRRGSHVHLIVHLRG